MKKWSFVKLLFIFLSFHCFLACLFFEDMIATQYYIKVLSPNGGEELVRGVTQLIEWDSSDDIENVNIELYDGEKYVLMAENIENTGTYEWEVPDYIVNLYICKISLPITQIPPYYKWAIKCMISAVILKCIVNGKNRNTLTKNRSIESTSSIGSIRICYLKFTLSI